MAYDVTLQASFQKNAPPDRKIVGTISRVTLTRCILLTYHVQTSLIRFLGDQQLRCYLLLSENCIKCPQTDLGVSESKRCTRSFKSRGSYFGSVQCVRRRFLVTNRFLGKPKFAKSSRLIYNRLDCSSYLLNIPSC